VTSSALQSQNGQLIGMSEHSNIQTLSIRRSSMCYYMSTNKLLTHQHSKSKVLPEPQGPYSGADLRFVSPQPDTSLHCETTDTGLVYRTVCPFTPQLSLVLTVPTHGGMARMS